MILIDQIYRGCSNLIWFAFLKEIKVLTWREPMFKWGKPVKEVGNIAFERERIIWVLTTMTINETLGIINSRFSYAKSIWSIVMRLIDEFSPKKEYIYSEQVMNQKVSLNIFACLWPLVPSPGLLRPAHYKK